MTARPPQLATPVPERVPAPESLKVPETGSIVLPRLRTGTENRTEPSPIAKCAPPGCRLPARPQLPSRPGSGVMPVKLQSLIPARGSMPVIAPSMAAFAATVPAKVQSSLAAGKPILAALEGEGARVTRVAGDYDRAVREAAAAARAEGSVLVQDTAWEGYEEVPARIVEGYSTLFAEVDGQLADAGAGAPDLVAVPVGVGSLAQAAVTHYRSRGVHGGPALLAVEPTEAAPALASLTRGESVTVAAGETVMAGLNCGTLSGLAWPVLRDGLDAAVTVPDAEALAAVRDLAALGVSSGPCGAAALAGARAALTGAGAGGRRAELGLGAGATVVLLSTEGREANPHGAE